MEFNKTLQEIKILTSSTKFVFCRADRNNKMAAQPLIGWDIFDLSSETVETWQEARYQCPLPSLCFSVRSENQDDRSGLWFSDTFSTYPITIDISNG